MTTARESTKQERSAEKRAEVLTLIGNLQPGAGALSTAERKKVREVRSGTVSFFFIQPLIQQIFTEHLLCIRHVLGTGNTHRE